MSEKRKCCEMLMVLPQASLLLRVRMRERESDGKYSLEILVISIVPFNFFVTMYFQCFICLSPLLFGRMIFGSSALVSHIHTLIHTFV